MAKMASAKKNQAGEVLQVNCNPAEALMAAEERAERAEAIIEKILLLKCLRLGNAEVRMKWILKVVRLEEVAGAALRMDIRS